MEIDARLETSLSSVPGDVRACEEIGFDGAWNTENRADPFLSLTLACEHSRRLVLGPAVAIAFARTPMTIAYPSWDLQRFSGGGPILGLGSRISFYGSTPAYRRVLGLRGQGELQDELHRLSKEGRWDDMPGLVDDDLVHAMCAVGSPGEVAELVAILRDSTTRATPRTPPSTEPSGSPHGSCSKRHSPSSRGHTTT